MVHRAFRAASRRLPPFDAALTTFPGTVLRVGLTFVCVCVGWVFFRAPTFQTAVAVLKKMFGFGTGELVSPVPYPGLAVLASACVVAHLLGRFGGWRRISARVPSPALGFAFAASVSLAMVLTPTFGKAFIYFQF